jgi:hypothetical protein
MTPVGQLTGAREHADFFAMSSELQANSEKPLRTFVDRNVAFQLTQKPSSRRLSVASVAEKYGLEDLQDALGEYDVRIRSGNTFITRVGGRRAFKSGNTLPFNSLELWNKVRIQSKSYHRPHKPSPPNTINATPPSQTWPLGYYNAAILNTDASMVWPYCGLKGNLSYILF